MRVSLPIELIYHHRYLYRPRLNSGRGCPVVVTDLRCPQRKHQELQLQPEGLLPLLAASLIFGCSFCWKDLLLGRAINTDAKIVVVGAFANSTAAPATVSAVGQ